MSDRANQFMSFDTLKGYREMVAELNRETEEKRELSEDDAAALSDKLLNIEKGQLATVTYYNTDCYETITGVVTEADKVFRVLTVEKVRIPFDDITDITAAT